MHVLYDWCQIPVFTVAKGSKMTTWLGAVNGTSHVTELSRDDMTHVTCDMFTYRIGVSVAL